MCGLTKTITYRHGYCFLSWGEHIAGSGGVMWTVYLYGVGSKVMIDLWEVYAKGRQTGSASERKEERKSTASVVGDSVVVEFCSGRKARRGETSSFYCQGHQKRLRQRRKRESNSFVTASFSVSQLPSKSMI